MSGELLATYRLQLGPGLGFAQARELVPYLRELGVSHLYLSPSLQARSGSTHGYDVVDPTRISEQLGGEAQFRELASAGLGVILADAHVVRDDVEDHAEPGRGQLAELRLAASASLMGVGSTTS